MQENWFILRVDSKDDSFTRYVTTKGIEIFDPFQAEPFSRKLLRFHSKDDAARIAMGFRHKDITIVVELASEALSTSFGT